MSDLATSLALWRDIIDTVPIRRALPRANRTAILSAVARGGLSPEALRLLSAAATTIVWRQWYREVSAPPAPAPLSARV